MWCSPPCFHMSSSPSLALRTCFDSSNLGEAQRECHGQIPVQWYTAEKRNADVDVGVEDESEQLAALLTVDPVIVLQEVVDPEGKRGDVEEVSHWQVHQVDAELIALPYLERVMMKGDEKRVKESRRDKVSRTDKHI